MRPRKLTAEQHKDLAEKHLIYLRAMKYSPRKLARQFGISYSAVRQYLQRKIA